MTVKNQDGTTIIHSFGKCYFRTMFSYISIEIRTEDKILRVLMICNRPAFVGIGMYSYSLFKAIKNLLGDSVEILRWDTTLIDKLYYSVKNIPLLEHVEEIARVFNHIIFMKSIPRGYSIYHFANGSLAITAKLFGPSVVTVHDLIPFSSPRSPIDLLIRESLRYLNSADKLICVSEYTKKELRRFVHVDPRKVEVIYNGVDHTIFQPRDKIECRKKLGLPLNSTLVLNVGSEEPRKNIPFLLNAFHKFNKEIPTSYLIRIGEKTSAIQKQIHNLGLNNKVLYFSNMPNIELFYNASDMLVFPSTYEGFGFPPLEAMSSGCPVIASDATSIPEVVGDAGILVHPGELDSFIHGMITICANETLRNKLIEIGLKQSGGFSWKRCARQTIELYKKTYVI